MTSKKVDTSGARCRGTRARSNKWSSFSRARVDLAVPDVSDPEMRWSRLHEKTTSEQFLSLVVVASAEYPREEPLRAWIAASVPSAADPELRNLRRTKALAEARGEDVA